MICFDRFDSIRGGEEREADTRCVNYSEASRGILLGTILGGYYLL